MGILNLTPDSFSDGGQYPDLGSAVSRVRAMVEAGAEIIDVGGESTRPGSDSISEETELSRVMPVLEAVTPMFPDIAFSIDTTKYEIARQALKAGTAIVNDVSGLQKEPRLAGL